MKRIKKALIIALFFSIGLAFVYLYTLRIEQVNKQPINNYSYYEHELSTR